MRAKPISGIAVGILTAAGFATSAAAAEAPTGVWIDHTGRGGVEIKDCGNGSLCGHVVWLKDSQDAKGCGLQILGNVKPIGKGQWDKGWIYSPEKKQKFSVELTPLDGSRLRVKGYKGIKLFSKTMIWHRANGELARCDTTTTASTKPDRAPSPPKVAATSPSKGSDRTARVQRTERATAPQNEQQQQDRSSKGESGQQTAKVAPQSSDRPAFEADDVPRAADDQQNSEDRTASLYKLDGLASLLENFASKDGIQVGDGYGMKVEEGPEGEKNCRLDVPFVTVKFPCE